MITLINVFNALNQKQINYCLLRGITELSEDFPKKEVDLLVLPDDLPEFVSTALGKLFSRFIEIYNLSREERKFLAGQIDFVDFGRKKFPLVFQYGDRST